MHWSVVFATAAVAAAVLSSSAAATKAPLTLTVTSGTRVNATLVQDGVVLAPPADLFLNAEYDAVLTFTTTSATPLIVTISDAVCKPLTFPFQNTCFLFFISKHATHNRVQTKQE